MKTMHGGERSHAQRFKIVGRFIMIIKDAIVAIKEAETIANDTGKRCYIYAGDCKALIVSQNRIVRRLIEIVRPTNER